MTIFSLLSSTEWAMALPLGPLVCLSVCITQQLQLLGLLVCFSACLYN